MRPSIRAMLSSPSRYSLSDKQGAHPPAHRSNHPKPRGGDQSRPVPPPSTTRDVTRHPAPRATQVSRLLGIDGGHVLDEVHHAVGVAPLVVVPRHQLHELGGEQRGGRGGEKEGHAG